jgi:hypothetical protein
MQEVAYFHPIDATLLISIETVIYLNVIWQYALHESTVHAHAERYGLLHDVRVYFT